jgi:hypothetical protein
MAEAFSNKLVRAAGIVTTSSAGSIGALGTTITGISTAGVSVSDLVDNSNFIAGSKVQVIGVGQVTVNRASTNTAAATAQNVKFLAPTEAYASPAGIKSILIGGTFANNTNSQVNLTVGISDNSSGVEAAIASKIPVPAGSSFVISDAGKTVLEGDDKVKVYCDVDNALDVNLSILTGVN